jgi:hypothetical protein
LRAIRYSLILVLSLPLLVIPANSETYGFTTFTLSDGPHVPYLDGNHNLNQIWWNSTDGIWRQQYLSGPVSANGLTEFDLFDGPHVIYVDANQHLHQIWYTTSNGIWSDQDLTVTVGGPQVATGGELAIFALSDGQHVVYADINQHLNQTWWNSSDGIWRTQDLTATVSGPPVGSGSGLTVFSIFDGPHVIYVDANQHLHQIWYTTSNGIWSDQDLTAGVGAPPVSNGSGLTAFPLFDGEHVIYIDANQHLHQIWWNSSSGAWADQDLTATVSGPAAASGTGLIAFSLFDGEHVAYFDTNQHVHQIWWNSSDGIWRDEDLTIVAAGAPATGGTGITAFSLSDGEHLLYLDANYHVRQMWWNTSTGLWSDEDLTALLASQYVISGQVTTLGSPLSGVNMILSGSTSGGTTTDTNGNYSFTVQYGGTYTITPSLSGYNFSPSSQTFNYLRANQVANFSAIIPGGPGTQPNAAREFIRFNGQVVAIENGH